VLYLCSGVVGGDTEYLVEWEGFGNRNNSWVKAVELDAPQLVAQYERSVLGTGYVVDEVVLNDNENVGEGESDDESDSENDSGEEECLL